jgi:hypothetical protein
MGSAIGASDGCSKLGFSDPGKWLQRDGGSDALMSFSFFEWAGSLSFVGSGFDAIGTMFGSTVAASAVLDGRLECFV